MTDEDGKTRNARPAGRSEHDERVAQTMRANLKKRKARARALAEAPPRPPDQPTER
ncbi:MAG: hypothetical protein AAFX81_00320 [Pseudomonadota bacterium]